MDRDRGHGIRTEGLRTWSGRDVRLGRVATCGRARGGGSVARGGPGPDPVPAETGVSRLTSRLAWERPLILRID